MRVDGHRAGCSQPNLQCVGVEPRGATPTRFKFHRLVDELVPELEGQGSPKHFRATRSTSGKAVFRLESNEQLELLRVLLSRSDEGRRADALRGLPEACGLGQVPTGR